MERIRTISGKLVSGARVALTDQTGETRVARTNPLGYYRFEDVPAGQTYIFEASHKRYFFSPQVLSVIEQIENLNFTAIN
jgi:hypothetical protein